MNRIGIIIAMLFVLFVGCSDENAMFEVDRDQCSGCTKCYTVCPSDAIRMLEGSAIIDPSKCTKCGNCIEICPENAIY